MTRINGKNCFSCGAKCDEYSEWYKAWQTNLHNEEGFYEAGGPGSFEKLKSSEEALELATTALSKKYEDNDYNCFIEKEANNG